jgi:ABC-type amino acid transport substrate-binding protein
MTLKVGVLEKDPFVINKDKLSGFTIDIWEYIAKKHNIEYSYHTIKNESDIDSAIDNNLYDVILGVIDLNADRIPKVDYTIPYYFTNFSLVNKKKDSNKEKIIELAKFSILIISYLVFTMTIYYFTAKDNISINEIIHYTFKNMSPYVAGARDTHILAKINYFFGFFFIILFVIGVYRLFYITEIISTVPKKPILVDSKSEVLDMYLSDPDNLAGVFVAEEGKIHNDGSIFNKNPKYQNLNFRRYNFGQNQVSIIMKKDHPLYANVNGELIKMREKGELFKISKKWLSYGQSLQLEI